MGFTRRFYSKPGHAAEPCGVRPQPKEITLADTKEIATPQARDLVRTLLKTCPPAHWRAVMPLLLPKLIQGDQVFLLDILQDEEARRKDMGHATPLASILKDLRITIEFVDDKTF